jgi:hypothetical protein
MRNTLCVVGAYSGRRFESREVLRELERGDPVGEALARRKALARAMAGDFADFIEADRFAGSNTISAEYYKLIFKTVLKGDAYTANVRIGVFSGNVVPADSLVADPNSGSYFRTALTEFTSYTVGAGDSTNRANTTFADPDANGITNSAAPSRFTFTGAGTLYGMFLVHGAALKSGAEDAAFPGSCYIAGAKFNVAQPVASGSIIDVVYAQSKPA